MIAIQHFRQQVPKQSPSTTRQGEETLYHSLFVTLASIYNSDKLSNPGFHRDETHAGRSRATSTRCIHPKRMMILLESQSKGVPILSTVLSQYRHQVVP